MISVVIPALNEEEAVGGTVQEVMLQRGPLLETPGAHDLEAVVVDNGSTDRTGEQAAAAGARVVREARRGYGRALKRGFVEARGDILVTLDADLTYPAHAIVELAAAVEAGHDLVIADRISLPENATTLGHTFGNRALSAAASLVTGVAITDTQSGMWAFRRSLLADLLALGNGMELSEQLKLRLARVGQWTELPILYRARVGESKLVPARDGLRTVLALMALSLRR